MARKAHSFFDEILDRELKEAVCNDFGKAVQKLTSQGNVREEVLAYFSATAMQQVNAIAIKYGINNLSALAELYQLSRNNLMQGFHIGQSVGSKWLTS